jgi:hypothetical protein
MDGRQGVAHGGGERSANYFPHRRHPWRESFCATRFPRSTHQVRSDGAMNASPHRIPIDVRVKPRTEVLIV